MKKSVGRGVCLAAVLNANLFGNVVLAAESKSNESQNIKPGISVSHYQAMLKQYVRADYAIENDLSTHQKISAATQASVRQKLLKKRISAINAASVFGAVVMATSTGLLVLQASDEATFGKGIHETHVPPSRVLQKIELTEYDQKFLKKALVQFENDKYFFAKTLPKTYALGRLPQSKFLTTIFQLSKIHAIPLSLFVLGSYVVVSYGIYPLAKH